MNKIILQFLLLALLPIVLTSSLRKEGEIYSSSDISISAEPNYFYLNKADQVIKVKIEGN
jgi:hypothetical protein